MVSCRYKPVAGTAPLSFYRALLSSSSCCRREERMSIDATHAKGTGASNQPGPLLRQGGALLQQAHFIMADACRMED